MTTTATPDTKWDRRIQAQHRYRRRRDRKIPVDWLGREFKFDAGRDELGQRLVMTVRVDGYNPTNHTVHMRYVSLPGQGVSVWDTDWLWGRLKDGTLVRN